MIGTACTVGNFRTTFSTPFTLNITGPNKSCPCRTIGLGIVPSGGIPGTNYRYEVRKSSDGVNYSPAITFNNTINLSVPCDEGDVVFAKVSAYEITTNTLVAVAYKCVEASMNPTGGHSCAVRIRNPNTAYQNMVSNIYPNPTKQTAKLDYSLAQDSNLSVELFDLYGRLIKTIYQAYTQAGEGNIQIDLNECNSGIYYCRLKTDNIDNIQRIVVTK
jgi:hypothetical protein